MIFPLFFRNRSNACAEDTRVKCLPDDIAVSARNFRAFYGKFLALDLSSQTLDIEKGNITALIGSSGCGKTTLLRWMNCMHNVSDDGQSTRATADGELLVQNFGNVVDATTNANVSLFERLLTREPQSIDMLKLRSRIGMVFQVPNPFPKSVFNNVAFGPRLQGKRKRPELDDIVEHALRRADVWDETKDRLNQNAMELSGGQQQRVCIARAIATDPEVLLMDEPTSKLDPNATDNIEELIWSLREQGQTIVIVTHNLEQAARIAKGGKTAFFDVNRDGSQRGILVEHGSTEDIFIRPKDERTQRYVSRDFTQ